MAATLPKRFEPFVVPGGLKGQISELPVPEVLQHLRLTQSTGILTLVAGGARKALYLKDGRVVGMPAIEMRRPSGAHSGNQRLPALVFVI